jgi:hypothetical protein
MPKGFMEEWQKRMEEEGRMLPPDHPIYSEPPSITFLSHTQKQSLKKVTNSTPSSTEKSSDSEENNDK